MHLTCWWTNHWQEHPVSSLLLLEHLLIQRFRTWRGRSIVSNVGQSITQRNDRLSIMVKVPGKTNVSTIRRREERPMYQSYEERRQSMGTKSGHNQSVIRSLSRLFFFSLSLFLSHSFFFSPSYLYFFSFSWQTKRDGYENVSCPIILYCGILFHISFLSPCLLFP